MVRIRKLAARDYKAVKKMERIIVDEYLGYLKETGDEDTIEPWITPEYFNHYVKGQAGYVAELARRPVGFILVQRGCFVLGGVGGFWVDCFAGWSACGGYGRGGRWLGAVVGGAGWCCSSLLWC